MPTGVYVRTKPIWNKGKKLSPLSSEQRNKISKSLLGKKKTEEHARHIGESRKGIPRSKECIEKIIATSTGQRRSPATEFKKGLIPWNKGLKGWKAGEQNGNWKGGKSHDGYGYVLIENRGHPHARLGYVLEHRVVVEIIIGRYLNPWEQVHHRDKVKNNNHPSNLIALVSRKWHVKIERGLPVPDEKIIFDGRKYDLPTM